MRAGREGRKEGGSPERAWTLERACMGPGGWLGPRTTLRVTAHPRTSAFSTLFKTPIMPWPIDSGPMSRNRYRLGCVSVYIYIFRLVVSTVLFDVLSAADPNGQH